MDGGSSRTRRTQVDSLDTIECFWGQAIQFLWGWDQEKRLDVQTVVSCFIQILQCWFTPVAGCTVLLELNIPLLELYSSVKWLCQNQIENLVSIISWVHSATFASQVLEHDQWTLLSFYNASPDHSSDWRLLEGGYHWSIPSTHPIILHLHAM